MLPNPEQDAQFAAEWDADVAVGKVAAVYAEALLDASLAQGESLADQRSQFGSLLTDVFVKQPKFEEVLSSSLISVDEKLGILDRTLKSQASPVFLNFLKVLAKHSRLDILRPIYREVVALCDQREGRIPVQVITAVPLDSSTEQSLSASLTQKIGGMPVFQCTVDPELIGGIIVRVGDTIYDASLSTQLKNVRQQMIDRSAHEIQSRRDRFSNPEGN
ncbi:MAG: ATP synthase F1 subunit delta [Thermoguttaceae bacterium]